MKVETSIYLPSGMKVETSIYLPSGMKVETSMYFSSCMKVNMVMLFMVVNVACSYCQDIMMKPNGFSN